MSLRRTLETALCSIALAALPMAACAAATVGQPAPSFSGRGADGGTVSLDAYRGKTVVLEWTNADCPFVKKHYESGNIPKLQAEATGKGVVWLQVISSAPGQQGHVDGATARKLNDYRGARPSGIVLDAEGTIGKLYGAQTTPHIFIIDGQGTLVYKGAIDNIASTDKGDIGRAENYVKTSLTALASGQKIATASTPPYGCSVKYSN